MLRSFSQNHLETRYSRDLQIQSMTCVLMKLKGNIFCQNFFPSGTSRKFSRQRPCASCTPAGGTSQLHVPRNIRHHQKCKCWHIFSVVAYLLMLWVGVMPLAVLMNVISQAILKAYVSLCYKNDIKTKVRVRISIKDI